MDIYSDYLPQLLLVVGLVLLAIEVAVLGFSTFILFFVGLGCVIASGLMYAGVLEHSILTAFFAVGLVTAISALLLWKPLKKLQMQTDTKPVQQDFIGLEFVLSSDVDNLTPGKHRYSGVEWSVVSDHPIEKGAHVKVVRLDVGKFYVERC